MRRGGDLNGIIDYIMDPGAPLPRGKAFLLCAVSGAAIAGGFALFDSMSHSRTVVVHEGPRAKPGAVPSTGALTTASTSRMKPECQPMWDAYLKCAMAKEIGVNCAPFQHSFEQCEGKSARKSPSSS